MRNRAILVLTIFLPSSVVAEDYQPELFKSLKLAQTLVALGIGIDTQALDVTLRVSSTHTVSTTTCNNSGNGMNGTPVNQKFSTTRNMLLTDLTYAVTFSSQRALRLPSSMRSQTTGASPQTKAMFLQLDSSCSLPAACLPPMSHTSLVQIHLLAPRTTRANGHMKALTSQVKLSD